MSGEECAIYNESDLNERLNSTDSSLLNASDEGNMFARTYKSTLAEQSNRPFKQSRRKSQSVSMDSNDVCRYRFDDTRNILIDSVANIYWTKKDQVRLQNLDNLHSRMIEHHNNVHTRIMYENWEATSLYSSTLRETLRLSASTKGPALAVMQYSIAAYEQGEVLEPAFLTQNEGDCFLAGLDWMDPSTDHTTAAFTKKWTTKVKEMTSATTREDLLKKLSIKRRIDSHSNMGRSSSSGSPTKHGTDVNVSTYAKQDLLWIQIISLAALDSIGARFGLHDLVITGFRDIRSSANFLPVPGGVFFCFCSFRLTDDEDVEMLKIYVYVSYTTNLIITFERKLMQRLRGTGGKRVKTGRSTRKGVLEQTVFNRCLELDFSDKFQAVLEFGVVEVIAMLAGRALSLQDPLITLLSRYLVYFKEVGEVGVKLHYREKEFVLKQLVVVKKSFKMVQTMLLEAKYSLTCLYTFLCTGTFKARDLYINLEDENRIHQNMSEEYVDFIASNVHVNFSGMGSTASMRAKPLGENKAGVKLPPTVLKSLHGRLFDIDIADCVDERTVLYKEYKYCVLNSNALERLHIIKEEYKSLCDDITDQFTDLALLERSDRKKDELRRINLENIVALVAVTTLPLTVTLAAASMNFSDNVRYTSNEEKAVYFFYWYHAPKSYIFTFVFCAMFFVAAYSYFGFLGLVDFSANTWEKLKRVLQRYLTYAWGQIGKKQPQKKYRNAVRRLDGSVVANVYTDNRERVMSMRISESRLERILTDPDLTSNGISHLKSAHIDELNKDINFT